MCYLFRLSLYILRPNLAHCVCRYFYVGYQARAQHQILQSLLYSNSHPSKPRPTALLTAPLFIFRATAAPVVALPDAPDEVPVGEDPELAVDVGVLLLPTPGKRLVQFESMRM